MSIYEFVGKMDVNGEWEVEPQHPDAIIEYRDECDYSDEEFHIRPRQDMESFSNGIKPKLNPRDDGSYDVLLSAGSKKLANGRSVPKERRVLIPAKGKEVSAKVAIRLLNYYPLTFEAFDPHNIKKGKK